ncbi:hypothetical protein BK816_08290 [Boudabousia tangfeifanii]|uniref:ABC-2 type transporter transmembrane domain-containing protein n=1 Tax=Boudabousia tangfeifanii TaxID=1912795 RepID=A0A1D9MM10_9ACTO|nr:ABC transporter permease [Boudabousia tangfeifanii]AOZ73278.1 hypothetical protein BK816_08290 [Boudabousia tangfeifanii]
MSEATSTTEHFPKRTRQRNSAEAPMNSHDSKLSRGAEIKLVIGRELKVVLFKKSTIITTIVMALFAIAGAVGMHYLNASSDKLVVGINDPDRVPGISQIKSMDEDASPVELVVMSRADGEKDIENGDKIDLFVDTKTTPIEVVGWSRVNTAFVSQLTALNSQNELAKQINQLGGDPQKVNAEIAQATPKTVLLRVEKRGDSGTGIAGIVVSFVLTILLFMLIVSSGSMVAMSVVEEKSSRIVEILLATVRSSSLLTGKVLGAGISSLITTFIFVGAGALTSYLLGDLGGVQIEFGKIFALSVFWLILGFFTYALIYAGAAATVSRQEDLGQLSMPIMMMALVPYIVASSVLPSNPDSVVAKYMSYVPVFAPFLSPSRNALGVATTTDNVVSIVLGLVFCPLMIWVSARIYRGAILRTGDRVKLKDAWNSN